jgi:hypothetical protein
MAAKKSGAKTAVQRQEAGKPATSVAARDDIDIIALDLPPGALSEAMKAYFAK